MIAGQRTRLHPTDRAARVGPVTGDETTLRLIVETLDGTPIGRLDVEEIDPRHCGARVRLTVSEPDAAGHDLGRDALAAVCRHLFDQRGLHRVGLTLVDGDGHVAHVYEELGFRREGILRDHLRVDGALRDEIVMSLLAGELRDQENRSSSG